MGFLVAWRSPGRGTPGLAGQHFITDHVKKNDIFPSSVEGFENVARDEHRHVAYGTWLRSTTAGEDLSISVPLRGAPAGV